MKKEAPQSRRIASSKKALDIRSAASQAERILKFWETPDHGAKDTEHLWSRWFVADPEFDRLCKTLFLRIYQRAARGHLEDWKKTPRTCLALVLLLDQFPRNMFRDTARAFATDAKAREVSRHALAFGFDREFPPMTRMFFYLPFEHSEHLDDQMESVRLSVCLANEYPESAEAAAVRSDAEEHLKTIRRFGRFPARNEALGRQSTKEESEFLKQSARSSEFADPRTQVREE